MAQEIESYARFEELERRVGRIYISFQERFANVPGLSKFWSAVALDEMEHASMLRFFRHRTRVALDFTGAIYERVHDLIKLSESISKSPDLTIAEAFYAALLVEASELDDVYSDLTVGWLPDPLCKHEVLYGAVRAELREHHEHFADAADRFLGDPAFGMAFRNLARNHDMYRLEDIGSEDGMLDPQRAPLIERTIL